MFGFLGDLFNGSKGAGYEGKKANILEPSLAEQQAFLNALQAQNGIGNQTDVYNQLAGVANGTGPNPAQAMLNEETGRNVEDTASLLGSQRGVSGGGGVANQIARRGGELRQRSVGQGATLAAQQQLAALGQMGGLATQQVGQQGNFLQGLNQLNANQQANINSVEGQVAAGNAAFQRNLVGGGLGSAGTEAFKAASGKGKGVLPVGQPNAAGGASFAEGGEVDGPSSMAGQFLKAKMKTANAPQGQSAFSIGMPFSPGGHVPGVARVSGDSLKNDTVSAKLSPGEIVLPRTVVNSQDPINKSAKFVAAILRKQGGGRK